MNTESLLASRLLAATSPLDIAGAALLLGACLAAIALPEPKCVLLSGASLGAGLYGSYLSFRLRLDAALFLDFSDGRLASWDHFDLARQAIGLADTIEPRTTTERAEGAVKLLKIRIIALAAQAALVLAACGL
ncbi:hypothetical protein [Parachitinimonas caeni]|uniref:Uncharacterized protein n=1 Tax=Parachitinimonas caeni TaxID=3031301 RepID=A0ABT7DY25_9NEIS|nr:hypothetical protein [Parachitinimonas caeni]MDK2123552.1 hypothetical protein [Parachitinimonas caeni]